MIASTENTALLSAPAQSPAEMPPVADPLGFGPGFGGWMRAARSFLAVLTLVLVVIIFAFAMYRREMNDPDIWWHLRNAQHLFEHHSFPRVDTYSFSVAGAPWINHEWLAEVPYYLAYRAFGLVGVKAVSFFTLSAIFLLLLHLCYQESGNFKSSAVACYFGVFLATISFGPRTILFGYLYLVVLLVILERFRRLGRASLWLIPPLFCLWINTHGSWSIGLIIFFAIGAAGLVGGSWGRVDSQRWTPAQLRKLIVTAVASLAALFVNPFGWRLVYYPFDLAFRQKLNIAHVLEWVSVDFHTLRGRMVLGLMLTFLVTALVRNCRWNLGELLILLFALYSGLTYIRFLMLLGIIAAPPLAKALDFFPPYRPQDETPKTNVVVLLALLAAMVYFWPRNAQVRSDVEETYPSGMLTYLAAHPPQGNVLNFYLWGGYLGWHDPSLKVFIDSRVDIFEYAGVLQDYLNVLGVNNLQRRPEPILDKYKIRYVLFPRSDTTNSLLNGGELVYVLEHDPHWKTLYSDKVSVLLEREPPAAAAR